MQGALAATESEIYVASEIVPALRGGVLVQPEQCLTTFHLAPVTLHFSVVYP